MLGIATIPSRRVIATASGALPERLSGTTDAKRLWKLSTAEIPAQTIADEARACGLPKAKPAKQSTATAPAAKNTCNRKRFTTACLPDEDAVP